MLFSEPPGKLYNYSGMMCRFFFINLTTSVRFFLSHDFSAHMDPPLDTFSMGFLHDGCITFNTRLVL